MTGIVHGADTLINIFIFYQDEEAEKKIRNEEMIRAQMVCVIYSNL